MKMKNKLIIVVLILFSISCKISRNENESEQELDWIIGNWVRTNEQENRSTFENWEKKNNSEYIGFSYTMESNDTIWQEKVTLQKNDGNWSFDVRGKGDVKPTKFKSTFIGKEEIVFTNPSNEFPKKIEYSKKGDKLYAKISGDDMEAFFDFEKASKK